MQNKNAVAIVGMGCVFPKANGLKQFWRLLFNGEDAITEVPEESHWSLEDYFDSDPSSRDHTYCSRGGFIPRVSFDPAKFGLPPNNLEATDTSQLLALIVAEEALKDAGYGAPGSFDRLRTNVILGVTGTQELVIPLGARLGHPIWKKALKESGIPDQKAAEVVERISGRYAEWQENSFPGLLGNVVAGRIANRLDLGGTNSVVDAACASSLSAINTAIMELVSGRCDMSITGGVDALNDIFMNMCFAKTGVLSHSGDARPFSKDADGTVLGEGVGMIVLKRLSDAKRDKDRIYAVIRGMGTSSDGRTGGIYAPDAAGQLRALHSAYDLAGVDPATVGMIEAHGTGTRVGDKIEFTALKTLAQESGKTTACALGSVKSMIGHSKAAAGAAGIIKSALCLYHKVLPATLKAGTPDPELGINNTPFYLNADAKPWVSPNNSLRRSGVSAFGFGGSNFHAVLEENEPEKTRVSWDGTVQIAAFSAATRQELKGKLKEFTVELALSAQWDQAERTDHTAWLCFKSRKTFSSMDNLRLLILIGKDDDATEYIQRAITLVDEEQGQSPAKEKIYFGSGPQKGKLAFLFPGQGSQYTGMGRDIISIFPEGLKAMEDANSHFAGEWAGEGEKEPLSDYIFPPPLYCRDKKTSEEMLRKTDVAQPALGCVSLAMAGVLRRFNILPDLACGHSFGELTALFSAGWMDSNTFLTLAAARGRCMAQASDQGGEQGSMLAMKATLPKIEAFLQDENLDLILANRNSHDQGVLSGGTAEIKKALNLCKERKIRAVELPVAAAFHSPLVENAALPFKERLKQFGLTPSGTTVFSNTFATPYPEDAKKAEEILGNQLLNPVNFVTSIEAMFDDNATTFVEVGPKGVLTGLTRSILKGKEFTAMALDDSNGRKSGIEDLARVVCELAAQGFPVDLSAWEEDAEEPGKKMMRIPLTGANIRPRPGCDLPVSPLETTLPPENPPPSPLPGPGMPAVDKEEGIPPAKTHESFHEKLHKSSGSTPAPGKESRGTVMPNSEPNTQQLNTPVRRNPPGHSAVDLLYRGLESMEALQSQTARAHERFLETQALASQTLQKMMEQTRLFAEPGFANPGPAAQTDPASATPPGRETSSFQTRGHSTIAVPEPPRPVTTSDQSGTAYSTEPMPHKPAHKAEPDHKPGPLPEAQPVLSPAPSSAAPEPRGTDRAAQTIIATVSRLTGFPQEMLEFDMEIESDLGIDSIKRVEIVSELERELPDVSFAPEEMGTLKTLQDILNAIARPDVSEPGGKTTAEPPPADKTSRAPIMTILVRVIAELTGFPEEMLEPGMDLESDLGIDSIKRVEILSRLEQELPDAGTFSAEKMTELKTLADIAAHLDESVTQTATVQTPSAGKETPGAGRTDSQTVEPVTSRGKAPGPDNPTEEKQSAPGDASLMRQIVKIKQLSMDQVRYHNGSRITLAESKAVYIAGETTDFSTALARGFNRAGVKAQVISMAQGLENDLTSMAGLVIVYDINQDPRTFLKSAFLLAKKSGPALMDSGKEQGALFTTVSFLGGSFGFDDPAVVDQPLVNPIQGGLAGLAKTAGLEWPGVLCRSLDLENSFLPDDKPMDAITNLAMIHGPVEMGVKGDLCNIPELVKNDTAPGTTLMEIDQDDLFVISGGARGVTAQCALALAKRYRPTIVLLGRSPGPGDEPQWLNGLTDEADIKRKILEQEFTDKRPSPRELDARFKQIVSNREIIKTLEGIRAANAGAAYFSVDVLDAQQVADCLERVKTQMGTITGIIHGAGVVADRFILDKDEALFSRVFDTKVQGLENLLSAVELNSLKHLVLFSSIAARMGNPGQVDYSMANEALNKMAQDLARRVPGCKTLSVNWGPWEGGMVTPLLRQKFENLGIDLIPPKAGAAKLMAEMASSGPVEVVIGGHLPLASPDRPKRKTGLVKAYETEVGTALFPILDDHCIAGQPVVPLALMVEWFAHGVRHVNPGLTFAGMDNMRVLKGIKPGNGTTQITVNTDKCRLDNGLFRVKTELYSDDSIHAQGTTLLAETLDKGPDHPPRRPKNLKPCSISVHQVYESILFHRGRLRGIKAIPAIGADSITVSVPRANTPDTWMKHPHAARWSMDPLILDCAFQAAIIWSHEQTGKACLPSHFSSLRVYEPFASSTGEVLITLTVTGQTAHSLRGDFSFVDDSNRLVAAITGFEAIMDPGLMDKFKPGKAEKKRAKKRKNNKRPEEQHKQAVCFTGQEILAFAEGRPSQAFGEPYTIFDEEREIARLPRPPFLFMDRIVRTDAIQWEMTPGGWIEAEFDLPRDAWYFNSTRGNTLPFAILLEIALQPCGWLAAYAGSALKSDDRLYFRNLGGEATLVRPITRDMGTLTMRARITKVSEAGGLIIQDFDMEVLNGGEPLYHGKTGFGFFSKRSLANQTGIRSTPLDQGPSKSEIKKSGIKAALPLKFKDDAPLTPEDDNVSPPTQLPSKALRMIDTIDVLTMEAGVYGKGYVRASKIVNPEEWFFKAHFYQDPVCPGSLGIESFLQTVMVYAGEKWKFSPQTHGLILTGQDHRWTYRGQITPENKVITIETHIKSINNRGNGENPTITADGILKVDGMIIYQMENFTLELAPLELPSLDGTQDRAAEPANFARCYT